MKDTNLVRPMLAATLLSALLAITKNDLTQVEAAYPPNLLNLTGCLYAYLGDGSKYEVIVPDNTDSHLSGPLQKFTYDSKSQCLTQNEHGKVIINFDTNDNYFVSMTLEMELAYDAPKAPYWEIKDPVLNIQPVNGQMFPHKQIMLRPASGSMYAPFEYSYSCSSLMLVHRDSLGHQFKITLRRFQLQPFHEPALGVFAASHDCSTWLTLPQIMGFVLILFIVFTVLIGVYLLLELGGHSSDLRFSKQGGMLMNQAQLDATKAD